MASLYEIDERLLNLENFDVDTESGEIAETEDDFFRILDEIKMATDEKIDGIASFIKNLESDVEAIKNEKKNLDARIKAKENLIERLKHSINRHVNLLYMDRDTNEVDMDKVNKWKFETARNKISYRKSESVNVVDETKLPKKFYEKITTIKADKKAIKDAIKNGDKVNGAVLETNLNIQIK